MNEIDIRVTSSDATTTTIAWNLIPDSEGFVLFNKDGTRISTSFQRDKTSWKISNTQFPVTVGSLSVAKSGQYPKPVPPPPPPPTPTGTVLWGAWVTNAGTPGAPTDMSQLKSLCPPNGPLANVCHWASAKTCYPGLWANIKAFNPKCIALCDWDLGGVTMADVAAGKWDSQLIAWADAAKATGVPTVIRFAHEFNADFGYSWQKATPTQYVAAWSRMAGIMQPRGIKTMWCPNYFFASSLAKDPTPWAPPANQVDWVGIDGYDSNCNMTFSQIFDYSIGKIRGIYPNKPLFIAETGVSHVKGASYRQAWLEDAFRQTVAKKLAGLVLFDRAHDDGTRPWDLGPEGRAAIANTVGSMVEYKI